jgi:hypothetical protein
VSGNIFMCKENISFVFKRLLVAVTSGAALTMSLQSFAAVSYIEGVGIYKLRNYTNGTFANCTAGTSVNVNTDGDVNLSCQKTALMNFGCDGTAGYSKAEGLAMWNTAQLAFAMGKQIDVVVKDTYQPGGVCTVTAVFTTGRDFP